MTIVGAGISAVGFPSRCTTRARSAPQFNDMFKVDNFSLFFNIIFLVSTILVALISMSYLDRNDRKQGPYYLLILLATAGYDVDGCWQRTNYRLPRFGTDVVVTVCVGGLFSRKSRFERSWDEVLIARCVCECVFLVRNCANLRVVPAQQVSPQLPRQLQLRINRLCC